MALVDDLRGLVAAGTAEYTDGAGTAYWTDAQLTGYLDNRKYWVYEYPITFYAQTGVGGTFTYTRGMVETPGRIEAGTTNQYGTVINSMGTAITGWSTTKDGWLTFTSDQRGSARYLTTYSYDLYAAAADVLEAWASNVKLHFDAKTDDQEFTRSQKHQMLMDQAKQYRRKQIVHVVPVTTTSEW